MKRYNMLVIGLFIGIIACSDGKKDTGTEITFRKENAIRISETKLFQNKTVIPLETTDNSLIAANPSLQKDGEDFFVYSPNIPSTVLRFNSKGDFLNKIGNIGSGPGEFPVITDVYISTADKSVEILSNRMIQRYAYDGKFTESLATDIPAFSFAHPKDQYWLYTGNNKAYSPYRLFQTNNKLSPVREYLKDESEMLPMMGNAFGNGTYLTFWENLYNNVYRITKDSLELSYSIQFPGLEIPSDAHQMSPMEVIDYLRRFHFATIRSYLENKEYVYLLIMVNKGKEMPDIYQWIINKDNGHETIVQTNLVMGSYLLSPQLLTADNLLYYIGYPIENGGEEVTTDANPSIVMIDISDV